MSGGGLTFAEQLRVYAATAPSVQITVKAARAREIADHLERGDLADTVARGCLAHLAATEAQRRDMMRDREHLFWMLVMAHLLPPVVVDIVRGLW